MTYNLGLPGGKPQQPQNSAMGAIETALIGGDLSKLSESDRVAYYGRVCESIGLNPLTKPFEYMRLNGKLMLYAKKDCADQLRSLRGVSITNATTRIEDGLAIVEVAAVTKDGRSDCDIGCVPIKGLSGEALGNALMKAVTKAKRRVTLSICGLGWLDETEIESIQQQSAGTADDSTLTVKVAPTLPAPVSKVLPAPKNHEPAELTAVNKKLAKLKWTENLLKDCISVNFSGAASLSELSTDRLLDFFDYLCLYEATSNQVHRLKLTPEKGKEILQHQFGKGARHLLTFKEISEFLNFLQRLEPLNSQP